MAKKKSQKIKINKSIKKKFQETTSVGVVKLRAPRLQQILWANIMFTFNKLFALLFAFAQADIAVFEFLSRESNSLLVQKASDTEATGLRLDNTSGSWTSNGDERLLFLFWIIELYC